MERNFILHISLVEIEPLIWRRVKVEADVLLSDLHHVIQLAMGWKNYHLYQFSHHGLLMGNPVLLEGEDIVSDRAVPLAAILKELGDSLMYEYDFGDGWMHEIRLEEILEEEKSSFPPVYLDGQRSSPPEDCGGVPGYREALKVLADKKHPEYKEMRTWVGRSFDPEKVDPDRINKSFHSISRYIRNYETGNGL